MIIKSVEGDAISPAAKKLLEENKKRMIEKQKSEKLSKSNMELYINLEDENKDDDTMPQIEQKVIKLDAKIPEDEDFGL